MKETIPKKLDERSQKAYESYKDESDSLLDDGEERGIFKLNYQMVRLLDWIIRKLFLIVEGDLIYTYKLKGEMKFRFTKTTGRKSFQIAVEVEARIYLREIDNAFKILARNFKRSLMIYFHKENFYIKELKNMVWRFFLRQWIHISSGKREIPPMYNSDLHAIFDLADEVIPGENFATEILPKIKKSKRLYNSTMIALGRGVKTRVKTVLEKLRSIGEILQKEFTGDTLQRFINEYMPLLTIIKIKEIADE